MSHELFSALKECGVENIQTWPAKITNNKSGETLDYVLGNILSVVDIIDNEASEIAPNSPLRTAILYKKMVFI